jgi:hypothetical protein
MSILIMVLALFGLVCLIGLLGVLFWMILDSLH